MSYQSYKDKLIIKISTTLVFKQDLTVFAARLLDYLMRDGQSIENSEDASFLLNKPYEMIGRTISTKFNKAEIVDVKRSATEATLKYRTQSEKVTLKDIPKGAPNLPALARAKYETDYRWLINSNGKLTYTRTSPNKLFSELEFKILIEQFYLLRWNKTEGDWIDRAGLENLSNGLFKGLNAQWISMVENRFSLPQNSLKILIQPISDHWDQEPHKNWLF